jgi:antitoxin component YwqK of YwqJK toxin-antitoxin module
LKYYSETGELLKEIEYVNDKEMWWTIGKYGLF